MYCSYKKQNILKLRAKVYQFELILILFKSRNLPLYPLYVFASTEEHFFPLCTLLSSITSFLPGGSPYPDINARKIAQKLQEGYRMPKPKHVEIKLWVIIRVGKRKFEEIEKIMSTDSVLKISSHAKNIRFPLLFLRIQILRNNWGPRSSRA